MKIRAILGALVLLTSMQVNAALILQASGATATSEFCSGVSPTSVIDQSGLSVGYTSLVTDFDAYISSGVTHEYIGDGNWFSDQLTTVPLPLNFDFDLGGLYSIEAIALWGDNQPNSSFNGPTNQSVKDFELLFADNADFISPFSAGLFSYTNSGNTAEVFGFASTTASHLRMIMALSS